MPALEKLRRKRKLIILSFGVCFAFVIACGGIINSNWRSDADQIATLNRLPNPALTPHNFSGVALYTNLTSFNVRELTFQFHVEAFPRGDLQDKRDELGHSPASPVLFADLASLNY